MVRTRPECSPSTRIVSPTFDFDPLSQEFVTTLDEGEVSMALFFEDTGAAELQLFENGAETPTWSKTVSWNWDCGEGCECGEDQAFCEGACIDVKEDPENCGGCGVTCGDDQMCIDHACVP